MNIRRCESAANAGRASKNGLGRNQESFMFLRFSKSLRKGLSSVEVGLELRFVK